MTQTNNINGSDVLLLQRLDTDSSDPVMYSVTLRNLSKYISLKSNESIEELADKVAENEAQLVALKSSLAVFHTELRIVQLDVIRHESDITSIKKRLNKTEAELDGIGARAKVHLYYNWIEDLEDNNPNYLQSGEMWAEVDAISNEIETIYYSTVDTDGIPVNQPYVFEGETLELTSAYDPLPSSPSKIRYRSIHVITEAPIISSDYIEVRVKTTHRFSDGEYPYYDEYSPQPAKTRTDFYPKTAATDELQTYVDQNYLMLNGSRPMSGNFSIEKTTPVINLKGTDGSESRINSTGTLKFLYGNSYRFEINNTNVKFEVEIDAGNQKIRNVAPPSSSTDAATKSYVDTVVSNIDLEDLGIEQDFTPGQQVAKRGSSGVEDGGFYISSSTLYVKM